VGANRLRNIVFRFEDPMTFTQALGDADQELPLPAGETVRDGEWVLAVFEVGGARTTTAAAARGLRPMGGAKGAVEAPDAVAILSFEGRDWERIVEFGRECGGGAQQARAVVVPADPPTKPSLSDEGDPPAPSSGSPGAASSGRAIKAPPRSRRSPGAPASSPGSGRSPGARVLLVDDERDILEVVGAMLDAVGLRVDSATSAEEALERVRRRTYDLVVLDWNLPGMTGIELCRLIRKDPVLATLPVLFLTAHAAPQDVVEAFASGADDYVVKPFRAPELGARIFGLLRRARMVTQSADS
jgi:two-component system phosphate regulon response regulator PhoB